MMKIKGKRFVASIEPIGLLNGSAIAPVTMKQQAYELIKDAILYRRLQIGITYSQDALCSELNISRTPVREALLELQQEGYIAFMRGKGIQVIPVTRKRAQDIVEARYYLELSGARLAAQRRTAAQIEALEQLLLEQEIEKLRDHFLRIETQSAFDSPEQAERVILEHRGILTAICAGDEKRAEEAMRYHLDCTAKRTLIHITDGLAD